MSRLRATVLELYRSVAADPDKPQDISRRFKVNRNLAWQMSRVLREEDDLQAVPLVPRAGAAAIMLDAIASKGAPAALVKSVRDAFEEFDGMVETHVGDRAELELLLDSMGRSAQSPLELSRKLAFKGNSGLWGLQAATRVTSQFIAPNRTDPNMADAAQVAGLCGVRRFRAIGSFPVFRIGRFTSSNELQADADRMPIDPHPAEFPGLIRSFCEGRMPDITCQKRGDGLYYDIGKGPIGRTGEFSCQFGFLHRRFVSRYSRSEGHGSVVAAVTLPAESLQFDLFIHRDIDCVVEPRADVYGKLWDESGGFEESTKLPLVVNVLDLGMGGCPGSRRMARYDELNDLVFRRAGWLPEDFRCHRVLLEYPPMTSVVAIRIKLPRQP